jgi:hypothetical protein
VLLQPADRVGGKRVQKQAPVLEEQDAVGHLERARNTLLGEHGGRSERVHAGEEVLRPLRIELGGRFIQEQEPRPQSNGGGEADSLELAGRELRRTAFHEMERPDRLESLLDERPDLSRWHACVLEPEGDLVLDAVHDHLVLGVLKDARHDSGPGELGGGPEPRVMTVNLDPTGEPAAVEVGYEPCECPQQRGLARPGGTEQRHRLSCAKLERDFGEGRAGTLRVREGQPVDAR